MSAAHALPGFTGDDVQPCILSGSPVMKAMGRILEAGCNGALDRERSGLGSGGRWLVVNDQRECGELLASPEPVCCVIAVGAAQVDPPKIGVFANAILRYGRRSDGKGGDRFHGCLGCRPNLRITRKAARQDLALMPRILCCAVEGLENGPAAEIRVAAPSPPWKWLRLRNEKATRFYRSQRSKCGSITACKACGSSCIG